MGRDRGTRKILLMWARQTQHRAREGREQTQRAGHPLEIMDGVVWKLRSRGRPKKDPARRQDGGQRNYRRDLKHAHFEDLPPDSLPPHVSAYAARVRRRSGENPSFFSFLPGSLWRETWTSGLSMTLEIRS